MMCCVDEVSPCLSITRSTENDDRLTGVSFGCSVRAALGILSKRSYNNMLAIQ